MFAYVCVQHGLYVVYPYVGLHRFAHWRSTLALYGLQNVNLLWGFDLVYPTWIMRATHMWVCLCVSNMGFMWNTYTHVRARIFAHTYQKTSCIARVSKLIAHAYKTAFVYT